MTLLVMGFYIAIYKRLQKMRSHVALCGVCCFIKLNNGILKQRNNCFWLNCFLHSWPIYVKAVKPLFDFWDNRSRLITDASLIMRKLWLDGRACETIVTPPISFHSGRVMEADMWGDGEHTTLMRWDLLRGRRYLKWQRSRRMSLILWLI